jgi:hypothetical protein
MLNVGPRGRYANVASALRDANDGDTIRVNPGTVRECFLLNKNVLVDGTGVVWDFSDLRADELIQRKGAIVVGTQYWRVRGFNITGAGIRETTHTLVSGIRVSSVGYGVIENCRIQRCQNGIGGDALNWVLEVRNCRINECGLGDGLTHNIYVSGGYSFTMIGGRSHDSNRGHALKSRAYHTTLDGGVFLSQSTGACIDCGSGGLLKVSNSTIVKPQGSPTGTVISYGAENDRSGLPDGNLVQKTVFALHRQNPTINMVRGTMTFAPDCTWQGNRMTKQGNGTVNGLPA